MAQHMTSVFKRLTALHYYFVLHEVKYLRQLQWFPEASSGKALKKGFGKDHVSNISLIIQTTEKNEAFKVFVLQKGQHQLSQIQIEWHFFCLIEDVWVLDSIFVQSRLISLKCFKHLEAFKIKCQIPHDNVCLHNNLHLNNMIRI